MSWATVTHHPQPTPQLFWSLTGDPSSASLEGPCLRKWLKRHGDHSSIEENRQRWILIWGGLSLQQCKEFPLSFISPDFSSTAGTFSLGLSSKKMEKLSRWDAQALVTTPKTPHQTKWGKVQITHTQQIQNFYWKRLASSRWGRGYWFP